MAGGSPALRSHLWDRVARPAWLVRVRKDVAAAGPPQEARLIGLVPEREAARSEQRPLSPASHSAPDFRPVPQPRSQGSPFIAPPQSQFLSPKQPDSDGLWRFRGPSDEPAVPQRT